MDDVIFSQLLYGASNVLNVDSDKDNNWDSNQILLSDKEPQVLFINRNAWHSLAYSTLARRRNNRPLANTYETHPITDHCGA